MTELTPRKLDRGGGDTIAYHRVPGKLPGVVFCTGYRSNMNGAKVTAVESLCRTQGRACIRFDYRGHGESSGSFEHLTLSDWIADAIAVIDELAQGPQVLVGSSMGGWIMVRAALARPQRIAGLIGVAAAPDFTEDLMWRGFPPEVRAAIERDGLWRGVDPDNGILTVVTRALIDDGRMHLVLRQTIPLDVPVRLLHGMEDKEVPWVTSQRLAERLHGTDVTLTLVKGGAHRLSEPNELALLLRVLDDLCRQIETAPRP